MVFVRSTCTRRRHETTNAPDNFLFLIAGAKSATLESLRSAVSMAKEIEKPKSVDKMLSTHLGS